MLKRLKLDRYKGFQSFDIAFGNSALLLGPNNAGKSTLIQAVKLCNAAAKLAMRIRPPEVFRDEGRSIRGWPVSSIPDDGFNYQNIHYEFEESLSRLVLEYESGAVLHMVWPSGEPGFFWISANGVDVVTAARTKEVLGRVGIVPTLAPLESEEKLLTPGYTGQHVESRLSSRHFRNNLRQVEVANPAEYADLMGFLIDNTEELADLRLEQVWRDEAMIDLFYRDVDSHVPKELNWAGDGVQIWLQILFHLWRTRDFDCVLLDEPDVFLHPDLQRRLVRVLDSEDRQTIMSSHAAEVASEADKSSLVWIERRLTRAKRLSTDLDLEDLSRSLGSSFNLGISRALKAKVALFVEGDDMKLIRILAKKCGATKLASETDIAVMGIGGFTRWSSVEAFGVLKSEFLGTQVKVRLLLDSDYRTEAASVELESRMAASSVFTHVWRRKELESYLIHPDAIARSTTLDRAVVDSLLASVVQELKGDVHSHFGKSALDLKESGEDSVTALARAYTSLETIWADPAARLAVIAPKKLIKGINRRAHELGGLATSARKLATTLKTSEIPSEMRLFFRSVEADLNA